MNTIDAIITRRSIRKYKNILIENSTVLELLKAGMYAPSARNVQPWYFVYTDKRDKLDELSEIHPYAKMLKEASLAILVCGDLEIEKTFSYIIQDCSAATQNILLAATDIGLGSVWLGIQPREDRIQNMKSYFNLPDHIIPVSLIAIGYPDEIKPTPERFIKERVKYNNWIGKI